MTWNDVLTLNFDVYKCLLMLKKWFEVKKWTLVSKKLDLVHVKEKMLTQIELSGKMGWGDQELSRSTEFQNFWVVVKVNEANFRYLKAINGLKL